MMTNFFLFFFFLFSFFCFFFSFFFLLFLFVDLDPDGDGVMDDLPKADEYHRTVIGRKLLRRQLFWENFLKYMNIKVEALALNHKLYKKEEIVVER